MLNEGNFFFQVEHYVEIKYEKDYLTWIINVNDQLSFNRAKARIWCLDFAKPPGWSLALVIFLLTNAAIYGGD